MLNPDQALRAQKQLAMKERTRTFARDVVLICRRIAKTLDGQHLAGQLIRCSTSVAANYRAACRARSRKEFVAKIGIVVEEADESLFWLEFSEEIQVLKSEMTLPLRDEANQLVSIFSATRTNTLKNTRRRI